MSKLRKMRNKFSYTSLLVRSVFVAMLFVGLMSSCGDDAVYHEVSSINEKGWYKNDLASFDYNSTDTTGRYDIIIDIRNSADYNYKNFWIFVRSISPDNIEYGDTLECVLADNYGKWIGKSTGSLYELPVLFLADVKFPKIGNYHFDIAQGMRNDTLEGIHEIGLRIKPSANKQE